MCVHPILIKNPNRGLNRAVGLNYLKDTESAYIPVPCGHCPECISMRQLGIVQRMNLEYRFNHLFFIMLSYKPNALKKITTSTGYTYSYADWSDLQNMFKRLRKSNALGRPFRYLAVNEYGGDKHRPHFHVMLMIEKSSDDDFYTSSNLRKKIFDEVLKEWRRNVAVRIRKKDSKSGKFRAGDTCPDNVHPRYIDLLEYHSRICHGRFESNYTVEYVRPLSVFSSEDNVSFYLSKYIFKTDPYVEKLYKGLKMHLEDDEFKAVWKLLKPRFSWSHGFGLNGCSDEAKEFVRNSIALSVPNGTPQYLAENGSSYPLSRFYYRFGDVFTVDLADMFYHSSGRDKTDGVVFSSDDPTKSDVVFEQYERKVKLLKSNFEYE